jgi:hypothetical protein
MTPENHIRLHELLLKRQELFARIYEAECEISEISQGQFKIPQVPVDLLSSQKKISLRKKPDRPKKIKIPALPHKKAFYYIKSGESRNEIYETRASFNARLKLKNVPISSAHLATYVKGELQILDTIDI